MISPATQFFVNQIFVRSATRSDKNIEGQRFCFVLLAFGWLTLASFGEIRGDERAVGLLRAKCISCHGADQAEGGLRLDSLEWMRKGGDHGAVVSDLNPVQSLLWLCVSGQVSDELQMPPKNPLTPSELQIIERWLASGATWSNTADPSVDSPNTTDTEQLLGDAWTDPRNPIVKAFGGERLDLWSVKPITQPAIPDQTQSDWCRSPIDRFVAAQFERHNVALPAKADQRTLLRRIHFDLTGLPPSPQVAAEFEASQDPRKVERLIDHLLADQQFGIHWARMWLDVTRYSDSNGFDWDEFRPEAYRYRDYVIRAFNQDKPYDQFIKEQLAGDESVVDLPRDAQEQDAFIATGFLRMGPHDNAAALFNEQDRSRDELMIDLVETTGSALLGMTLSCCRCHDHKYDPVTQADYFRFRACFANVRFADDLPIDLAEVRERAEQQNSGLDEQLEPLETQSKEILAAIRERLLSASPEMSKKEKKKIETLKPAQLKKQSTEAEKEQLDAIETKIRELNAQKVKLNHAMLMVDEDKPRQTFVLYQGDYKSPRQQVEPGILSILNPNELKPITVARPKSSGRRTALAQWIVDPQNPLTARVMVNRVWLNLMGQGLVRTPGDFGLAGTPPDDPALLDWLSRQFVEEGWSVKQLIRRIMLSATYQQVASYQEPLEALSYASRRPRRLTAEQWRDSMLLVSGLLTGKSSGPPQWPDIPREVLEANPAFLDDNETKTKGWYPSPKPEQYCRSIFLVQKRNTRVPLLETLDQPENSVPCQRRAASIVAPQALSLLNGAEAIEAARQFAQRIEKSSRSNADRVRQAFLFALQRLPSPSEQAACEQALANGSAIKLSRALFNANEFLYVD